VDSLLLQQRVKNPLLALAAFNSECHCPARPRGTEDRVREKSLLRADDGNPCGCRLVLEGVVMASIALSLPQAIGETLCLTRQAMRRRCLGIVPSLGAPCELLAESLGNWWSWFWSQNRAGHVRAQCTPSPGVPWQRLLLVQSEPAVHSPILLLGIGVGGTLLRAIPSEVVRRMLWNRS
jgi:hypothetical protein